MSSSMTTEWRVRWDRTDRTTSLGECARTFSTYGDAEDFAHAERLLDVEGVDGMPIANPLTFGPVIEQRVVSAWVNWAEPTGAPVPTIDRVTWDEDEWYR